MLDLPSHGCGKAMDCRNTRKLYLRSNAAADLRFLTGGQLLRFGGFALQGRRGPLLGFGLRGLISRWGVGTILNSLDFGVGADDWVGRFVANFLEQGDKEAVCGVLGWITPDETLRLL